MTATPGRAGIAVAAALLMLAGCSSAATETPPAEDPPASGSALPAPGVPKVAHPLDTTAAEADPCSVLTTEEIQSLGETVATTEPQSDPAIGPVCDWRLASRGLMSIDSPAPGTTVRGLSDIYDKGTQGDLPDFEPTTIAGYPAVIFDKSADSCAITIGVRDDKIYNVQTSSALHGPNEGRDCDVAHTMGEFVIAHLQGAPT